MKKLFRGGVALLAMTIAAGAQPATAPQVSTIGNTDLFQDVVNGFAQAQSFYASAATLSAYFASQPVRLNALIGGDATTNLWQRGTAGVSTTSGTVAWDSADHWGQWSLATAGAKIVRDSTAADLPSTYKYAAALTHTNTTAGQICMGQPLESVNSYQFAGQVAELDFHAATGAGYTGGSTITAYIVYGTGTDDGLNEMAFTVNGGGATGWAGGALATSAVIPLNAVKTLERFAAIANIPATATEVGVALCYTPSTTDTNDYVAFSGIQLVRSPQLASFVSTTKGYQTDATPPPFAATSFQRRPAGIEASLQYRFAYYINEAQTGSAGSYQTPAGIATATTTCQVNIPFPVNMFKSPSIDIASAGNLSASTFAIAGGDHADQALSTPYAALTQQSLQQPFNSASVTFTTGATLTQYWPCLLDSTASGTGKFGFTAED